MDKNRRKHSSSGETFSFPSTPSTQGDTDSSDFEFGSLTPDSPSQDPNRDSPADHLFFNGRLLPHAFPLQQQPTISSSTTTTTTTSRTNSISSKDSLMSSRSNSTNSRSSNSSSARTSLSDNYNNLERRRSLSSMNHQNYRMHSTMASKLVSSQRWQYITPVPGGGGGGGGGSLALKRSVSDKSKNVNVLVGSNKIGNPDKNKKKSESGGFCWLRRFFRWFMLACKECHAMEPSKKDGIK